MGFRFDVPRSGPPDPLLERPAKEPKEPDGTEEAPVRSSGWATACLVFGLLSLIFAWGTAIPGIVFGVLAFGSISASRGRLRGKGTAVAGLIFCGVGFVVTPIVTYVVLVRPAVADLLDARAGQRMQLIGAAIAAYHDEYRSLPSTGNPEGGAPMTWRVAVLPYLGQGELYDRIDFDATWDSPRNAPLFARTPPPYFSPRAFSVAPDETVYLAPIRLDSRFERRHYTSALNPDSRHLAYVTDGYATVVTVVEADDESAVPWASPRDLDVSGEHVRRGLREVNGAYLFLMGDGSVRRVSAEIDDETLGYLYDRDDGHPVEIPE